MSDMTFVGRRTGRPPRAGVKSTQRIEFVVTPEERQSLERVAKANKQAMATVIRDAVNSFVQDYGGRVVFLPSGDSFTKRA
jgi:hypothetical protein